jgi:hypothetical protein
MTTASYKTPRLFFTLLTSIVWVLLPVSATTSYFLDPHWNGVTNGTASAPWRSLTENSWVQINSSLRTDDVIVFFSARPKTSDVDNCYDSNLDGKQDGIDLVKRTTESRFFLTFDGGSFFKAQDTGRWVSNSGKSMCKVKHFNSQNSDHKKISRISINKFKIEKCDNGKAIAICGDFWTISNCDVFHTPQVHDGPLILLVPVADKRHGGSDYYAPACTDISMINNTIHHSCGELIYLGGGGCLQPDSIGGELCKGFPSHTNITISKNILYEGGIYGQEGDAIDCKGGLSNVRIVGNEIRDMHSPVYRAITMKGQNWDTLATQAIIEKNFIHHCTHLDDAAIAIVNNWGTPGIVEIRNNIVAFNDRSAIKIYGGKAIRIINNTLYRNGGLGIDIQDGIVTIQNNLLIDNLNKNQIFFKGQAVTCSNNGFSGVGFKECSNCIEELSDKILTDVSKNNFSPSKNIKNIQKGIPDKLFLDDFTGKIRSSDSWTLGAFEMINNK